MFNHIDLRTATMMLIFKWCLNRRQQKKKQKILPTNNKKIFKQEMTIEKIRKDRLTIWIVT